MPLLEARNRRIPHLTLTGAAVVGSRAVGAILALVLIALPACGVSGLNFRQDERIIITAPLDRAKVDLPLTVTWRVRDFDVTGRDGSGRLDAGYFGLLLDRPPQPAGRPQAWLVREDQICLTTPGCPNPSYLAQVNIFSTTETSFTIERIPDPTPRDDRREFHEITIVFLNGRGERIGESAFTIQFEVNRKHSR